MNTYIVTFTLTMYYGSNYEHDIPFEKLVVEAASMTEAARQAAELKPLVVARHVESTEDPPVEEDDHVKVGIELLGHFVERLRRRTEAVKSWTPEEDEDIP